VKKKENCFLKVKQHDDEAFQRLVTSNLKLVVYFAIRRGSKEYLEDLIQEGNLALMKAVLKYDLSYGCKFSYYASIWIKQFMQRYLQNYSKNIRVPVYMDHMAKKCERVKEKFMKKGKTYTMDDIAKEMKTSVLKVETCYRIMQEPCSLDTYVNDNNETLGSQISSNYHLENEMMTRNIQEKVWELLDLGIVSDREKQILIYRFGLCGSILPFEKIGQILHISGSRVQQLEARALKKLRLYHQTYKLASLIDDGVQAQENLAKLQEMYLHSKDSQNSSYKSLELKKVEKDIPLKIKPSIYEWLHITKEEFETIFFKLTEEEKEILSIKWFYGFENPTSSMNLGTIFNRKVRTILVLMQKMILNPDYTRPCYVYLENAKNRLKDRAILDEVKNVLSTSELKEECLRLEKRNHFSG